MKEFRDETELKQWVSKTISTSFRSEVPEGRTDGSNLVFRTSQPFHASSVRVFLNGRKMIQGSGYDFIVTGDRTIQFLYPPYSNSTIEIEFISATL